MKPPACAMTALARGQARRPAWRPRGGFARTSARRRRGLPRAGARARRRCVALLQAVVLWHARDRPPGRRRVAVDDARAPAWAPGAAATPPGSRASASTRPQGAAGTMAFAAFRDGGRRLAARWRAARPGALQRRSRELGLRAGGEAAPPAHDGGTLKPLATLRGCQHSRMRRLPDSRVAGGAGELVPGRDHSIRRPRRRPASTGARGRSGRSRRPCTEGDLDLAVRRLGARRALPGGHPRRRGRGAGDPLRGCEAHAGRIAPVAVSEGKVEAATAALVSGIARRWRRRSPRRWPAGEPSDDPLRGASQSSVLATTLATGGGQRGHRGEALNGSPTGLSAGPGREGASPATGAKQGTDDGDPSKALGEAVDLLGRGDYVRLRDRSSTPSARRYPPGRRRARRPGGAFHRHRSRSSARPPRRGAAPEARRFPSPTPWRPPSRARPPGSPADVRLDVAAGGDPPNPTRLRRRPRRARLRPARCARRRSRPPPSGPGGCECLSTHIRDDEAARARPRR